MTYFDTNYLIRLYWDEPGAIEVRDLAAQSERICCARHGRTEFFAALKRKGRESQLSDKDLESVFLQFEADCAQGAFLWLPMDEQTFARAERVIAQAPQSTFLRSGDALHLAAASERHCTVIYSHDRHLLAAAPLFEIEARDVIPT